DAPKKYRLAIVEDREPVLETLKLFFEASTSFDLRITARSFEEFTDAWKNETLDIVLSDIGLPGKSGIETTWYIKRRMPEVQVVMFTVFENKDAVFQALRADRKSTRLNSSH